MEHGGHEHGHADNGGHGMDMAMSMVFTASTKVTLLFSWWSTTTVTSYIFTLLFLFLLALFNRFLGILKLRLDLKRADPTQDLFKVPKLNLPPSRWPRNRKSKGRVSPLPRDVEINDDDTDRYGVFHSAPLLAPTSQLYSEESHTVASHRTSLGPCGRWSLRQDGTSALLEGLRALFGYALMLAVMTYNVGVLCAVLAGILVGELFLGRYSPPSSGWQDGACHDS
ncbi:copper transporter crmD [Penicillium cinerascens]|uniref:Copper transport protein n=1 Tax=Penicillium cinerascens TaxID=70096 RepID=A0A9W9JF39_9EURO|nr:copper transporter crmD [Penicillium cinerascens]KAJ5194832.1 copper transporter crmD [Penicillium cinerascens]